MRFANICGMLGNPNFYGDPYQRHTGEQLAKLREMNVDTVFINIAWSRPWIDAVNLEHVAVSERFPLLSDPQEVEKHRRSFAARAQAVKKAGMRAFALFGIPRYFDFSRYPEEYLVLRGSTVSTIASPSEAVACIQSPDVSALYRELLSDLLAHVPELDGIEVYTYDELAEVCDEDSDCPRCRRVPVENRIPPFLNGLKEHLQLLKPGFELWWEPWELSAAQTYKIVERLDPAIGLALHSSLHEVYFANETDQWFRNLTAIARDQGRKVIGEIFAGGSGEDLGNVVGYPCPRLVAQQIQALARLPGVTGFKEYYGFPTEYASVNEEAMRLIGGDPSLTWEEVAVGLSEAYSPEDAGEVRKFWENAARAIEFIPWEFSWVMRFSNLPPYGEYWGSRFVDLFKTPWSTPSWLSNRRSFYLVVDNESNFTPRMQIDLIDRLTMASDRLAQATAAAEGVRVAAGKQSAFALEREAVELLGYMVRCRLHHLELSFIADRMRSGEEETGSGVPKLLAALDRDAANAEALLGLLRRSAVPYTFKSGDGQSHSQEAVVAAIRRIRQAKSLVTEGEPADWLARYF